MRRTHMEDKDLVEVIKYVKVHDKAPSYIKIWKFRPSVVKKYLLQFDRLILLKDV